MPMAAYRKEESSLTENAIMSSMMLPDVQAHLTVVATRLDEEMYGKLRAHQEKRCELVAQFCVLLFIPFRLFLE